MNEQQRKQYELIRERRFQAANEAQQIAHELGLDESEAERFISDAVSNAIWDAQQMRPYRVPVYKPAPSSSGPLYKELIALARFHYPQVFARTGFPIKPSPQLTVVETAALGLVPATGKTSA